MLRTDRPRRRIMCGELVDVLTTKLADCPGKNSVLYPPTSGSTRIGLGRSCSSSGPLAPTFPGEMWWFVSFKNRRRCGLAPGTRKGLYIAMSSFSVRNWSHVFRILPRQIPTGVASYHHVRLMTPRVAQIRNNHFSQLLTRC